MTDHVTDDLPGLLSGEADHDTVLIAAAHLRSCPDCHEELVAAVVAHASLSSAHRFAPDVVVRETVADLFGGSADDGDAELPDLSAVFAQARSEATSPAAKVRARARSAAASPRRGRNLVAAAVAAVLIGGGATTIALTQGGSAPAGRQVALAAYDDGHSSATATIESDGELVVDATSLPHVTGQRYEVWLTDATRSSMKPVGWIGSDGKAQLTVPSDLMGTYSYIEVSRQSMASKTYAYSGTSVLRGKYTA